MTILFVTSIAVIQGKMHVDWHVYKFVVSFTVWLQPFNNSVAAMNCIKKKPKTHTRSLFTKEPYLCWEGIYIC